MFYLVVIFLLFLMFDDRKTESTQIEIDGYKTQFFQKDSIKFFEKIKEESGYSDETLKELAMMEDQFLEFEKQTVCYHISRLREAMTLDQQMRDRFQGVDFIHHQIHIKQMSEPSKIINKDLSCA